jgi:hypothetical protein
MDGGIGVLNLVFSIQGLKSIGYVQLILSPRPTTSSSGETPHSVEVAPIPTPRPYLALGFAALAFLAAFSVPFLRE